jgi:hypothetical protein
MSFNPVSPYPRAPSWNGQAAASSVSQTNTKDDKDSSNQNSSTKLRYVLSPSLELITAFSYLLHIPRVNQFTNKLLKRFPNVPPAQTLHKMLPLFSHPRTSNRLLLASIFTRYLFASSIGVHQEQAGMLLSNIIGLLFNAPLMIAMEIAVNKRGIQAGQHYAKVLALVNLMLTGLFATGFVQKAKKDDQEPYYIHDMQDVHRIFNPKNHLHFNQRLKLSMSELKVLLKDSVKAYQKAGDEVQHSFTTRKDFHAFLNPMDPNGTPGRVAFSAFTMPLGALIALLNVKSNPKLSFLAAGISIIGNLENGLALALSSLKDKDQPLRGFGVIGGLFSPLAEAVLTSKSPLGPACMTSANAFQNLYQATAWTSSKCDSQHPNLAPKQVLTPKKDVLLPPEGTIENL